MYLSVVCSLICCAADRLARTSVDLVSNTSAWLTLSSLVDFSFTASKCGYKKPSVKLFNCDIQDRRYSRSTFSRSRDFMAFSLAWIFCNVSSSNASIVCVFIMGLKKK